MNRPSLVLALVIPSLLAACGAGENTVGTEWLPPDATVPGDASDTCTSCTSGTAQLVTSVPEVCLSAPVGERSASQKFEISNQGTGPSGTLKVNLSGANAASFVITSDTCTGTALVYGTLCTVTAAYAPAAAHANAELATLTVSDDQTSINAFLHGSDIGTVILSPAAVSFGTVEAGGTSPESVFQVATTSYCGITWTAALDNPNFVITTNTCTGSPKVPCLIGVRLAPPAGTNPSSAAGLLTVTASDSGSATVSLTGFIGPLHPTPSPLAVSPAAFNFGGHFVGQSGTGAITISHATASPTVAISGSEAAEFAIVANTCTAATVADETCTIKVKFAPTTAGAKSATLTIQDGQSTATVTLQGEGFPASVAAPFTATPMTLDFGRVSVTLTSPSATITVSTPSARTFTLSLSDSVASQMAIVGDTCTGALIPASGTCTISMAYKPIKTGRVEGTLNISDGTDVVAVQLVGEGWTLL